MIIIILACIAFFIFILINIILSISIKEKTENKYIVKLEKKILQLENIARIKLINSVKFEEEYRQLKKFYEENKNLEIESRGLILENLNLKNSIENDRKSYLLIINQLKMIQNTLLKLFKLNDIKKNILFFEKNNLKYKILCLKMK